ncbi:MAG: inositol monophosphatase family protein [Rubrobacteraceae bacterium]
MTKELDTAIEAAKAAGEVLREGFGGKRTLRYKGEVDIVTEMDERAERIVLEILTEAFPDYGILAEESGLLEREGDGRWVVDPLDGTTNYAHGLPIFSVSIALQRAGEVFCGVVHDPMRDETFVAERGAGATANGRPIEVSGTNELIRSLLATGFPYDRNEMPEAVEVFGRFAGLTRSIRRLGSAALDLCYVAAGRLDGYYEGSISPWDIAAGSLIVQEAGGKVTDYGGREFSIENKEILASNGVLHDDIANLIGKQNK